MKKAIRPTIFKWRQTEPELILCAVRWYLRYSLSGLRDAAAAKHLFRKALTDPSHPQPRVINTGQARIYDPAILAVQEQGTFASPLPTSAGPILEQHPGAGPSSDQTTSEGQAGLS